MNHARELDKVREETRTALRRGAYFWFVMVATTVLSAGLSVTVTVVLTERSERKLCAVVVTTDDAYLSNPPTTDLGKVQASNFTRLRKELGCQARKASQ